MVGTGNKSRWGEILLPVLQPGTGTHLAYYTMDAESFLGLKRPGRNVNYASPSSTEVKKRVELTSTLLMWLHGRLQDEIYLYLYTF